MEDTVQLNFRLSPKIVADMDFIAKKLNIGRNDWLRFRLAELIEKEKAALSTHKSAAFLMDDFTRFKEGIEAAFIKEKINEEEFKQILGYNPSAALLATRQKEIDANWEGTLALKKYLLDIAEKNTERKKIN